MLLTMMAMVMALAAAEPQPAATTAPETTAAPPAKPAKPPKPHKDDSQRIVCEDAPETGSIISRQVCATKAEWERRRQHDLEEVNRNRDGTGRVGGE
jgi:hypothetical protein